jgi:hypothetical protein
MWHVCKEKRDAYGVLGGKLVSDRPLGRPRRRWSIILNWIIKKYNVGVDYIDLAEDEEKCRVVVKAKMGFRAPQKGGLFTR